MFFFDIFVQSNTAFIDKTGKKVFSRWAIMKRYASSWLVLDLASILPFETVDVIVSGGGGDAASSSSGDGDASLKKAVRFIRLLRLMKLLRVLRGMRIFARWEARLALNYAVLSLQARPRLFTFTQQLSPNSSNSSLTTND